MNDKYIAVAATGEETDTGDSNSGIVYVYDAKTRRRLYALSPTTYFYGNDGTRFRHR